MPFRALALILAGVVLFSACDSGRDYPANKGDDDYKLDEMALTQADLPKGFQQIPGNSFSVEEWADVFDTSDPEGKVDQLKAQGWLSNYVTESVPPSFGKVLNIRSLSTLYTNEDAAKESTSKFACGLPINDNVQLTEFIVPKIADQSFGFFHEEQIDPSDPTTLKYTTVCFRTGRIVNVIQQASLPGLEDIGLALRFAEKMLGHIDDSFDGKGEAPTPAPENG